MFSGEDDPSIWFPKQRPKSKPESIIDRGLEFLKEYAPPLKIGDRAIPGAVTALALPVIMVGIGFLYLIQRR